MGLIGSAPAQEVTPKRSLVASLALQDKVAATSVPQYHRAVYHWALKLTMEKTREERGNEGRDEHDSYISIVVERINPC